jgi:undecaprenyl-diphosphatase
MTGHSNRPRGERHARAWFVAVAAALGFGLLTALVAAGITQPFDERVLAWAAGHRTPRLDRVMLEATMLGASILLYAVVAVAILFLWLMRQRGPLLLLLFAGGGGPLVNNALKHAIARARPEVVEHLADVFSPSFPSGHAMNSIVVYGIIAFVVGRFDRAPWLRTLSWSIAALLVVVIGATRVYLGVHYPADVVAGWLAGVTWIGVVTAVGGPGAQPTPVPRRPADGGGSGGVA